MIKVREAFDLHPTSGEIGVEIEVEGDSLPLRISTWSAVGDDSLRGESREYVLREPLSMSGVRDSLDLLQKAYVQCESTIHDSVRAGVHVHINIQELTTLELYNYLTTYIILEDLLIKYCGEYREGNLFCLRTRDAEYLIQRLEQVASNKMWNEFRDDLLRYASVNVCSIPKFGSLEFRAMRGTRDLNLIGDWAEILLNLRNECVKFDTPKDIVALLDEVGAESFCKQLLGTYFDEVCNGVPFSEHVLEGRNRSYPLVMLTDWSSFETISIGGLEFPVNTEFPDAPMEDF